MCPEGVETRRTSSLQPLGREAECSTKPEMGGPGANVTALCQGLYFFCPCFICPMAIQRTFSFRVVNLQVSWAFNSLNNLFFTNVSFEPQSSFIKNNFLLEIQNGFNILKQLHVRSHEELVFRFIKRLLKYSNKIVFCCVSEALFNIKNKYSTGIYN